MILKELDPFTGTEPFELAGRRAEEQMAFYLRREFGDFKDVFVLNGLRLEREGDACQIDHLLVHRYGFVIVESKSVTTEVSIDNKGDWSRLVEGKWKGMPSPINQAKLQFKLLHRVLDEHAPKMLGKLLGLQMGFGSMQFDEFAAVSDNGIINWPTTEKYGQVCKADGVCELILGRIRLHKSKAGLTGFAKSLLTPTKPSIISHSEEAMHGVAVHLRALHVPRTLKLAPEPVLKPLSSTVLVLPGGQEPTPTAAFKSGCADCGVRLSPRVMSFCRVYPTRFGGKVLCMSCQAKHPVN